MATNCLYDEDLTLSQKMEILSEQDTTTLTDQQLHVAYNYAIDVSDFATAKLNFCKHIMSERKDKRIAELEQQLRELQNG